MRNLLIRGVANAIAIWVAAAIVPGVDVTATNTVRTVLTLLVVGLILAALNAIVKPVLKVLAIPLYILTLGLMAFVVNAFMLQLTEWLAEPLGLGFSMDDFFWSAIGAAVVVTVVSMVLNFVLPGDD